VRASKGNLEGRGKWERKLSVQHSAGKTSIPRGGFGPKFGGQAPCRIGEKKVVSHLVNLKQTVEPVSQHQKLLRTKKTRTSTWRSRLAESA